MIVFSDESQTGNVLHARQPRKANMVFFSFLEFPLLSLDAMWLPLAAMRAQAVKEAGATYAVVMRALLEATRAAVQDGFPVELSSGPALLFIDQCILLGDHEGLRSLSGCKGAAGFKPCLKCTNVLANGKLRPPGYVGLGCADAAHFALQTDEGLAETLKYLQGCRTKKALQESETLLGWNMQPLADSVLFSPDLRPWITLDSMYFDQMHELWSNGVVSQDLGLWYTRLLDAGCTAATLRQWVQIGWRALYNQQNLTLCFADALWKRDQDFRGDASACLVALPLCAAFSVEMLATHACMRKPSASLLALYAAARQIFAGETQIAHLAGLAALQEAHVRAFQDAYGAERVRPKMHYALHVPAQAARWGRVIDCFVGERKHRLYKSEYGPRLCALKTFARSALLHQLQAELSQVSDLETWTGRLVGAARRKAISLGLDCSAQFGLGIEYRGIVFRKGGYVILRKTCAVEIHGGVQAEQNLWLLVETLEPGPPAHEAWPTWQRGRGELALMPVQDVHPREPMRLVRECANSIWLLR